MGLNLSLQSLVASYGLEISGLESQAAIPSGQSQFQLCWNCISEA